MNGFEIFLTVLLNALPIIIMIIPLFFIWKKTIGKLYLRIVLGIIVFYLIYWILPMVYQYDEQPNNLQIQTGEEGLSLAYMTTHFLTLINVFASYPLITLPFIFFLAPFISFIIIWLRLRKEEGPMKEKLDQITYEYNKSPLGKIREGLLKKDWSREKEIFKLMIVLLPISLYILQAILKITNLQGFSFEDGETALGWFLEILFVYLAVLILSIELLSSGKIAIKGRYFGEKVRENTFRSLYTVGVPISLISILLFGIEYYNAIDLIFYFFAYFMMASIILILFLDFFEPISILILVKLINWWKNLKQKFRQSKKSNIIYGIVFGGLAVVIFLVVNMLLSNYVFKPQFGDTTLFSQTGLYSLDPSLSEALKYDIFIILNTIVLTILPILISSIFLIYIFKFSKNISIGFLGYLPIVIIISIILSIAQFNAFIEFQLDDYWITGRVSGTYLYNYEFFTLRTAGLEANLSDVLFALAIPYIFTRNIANIVIWGLLVYYLRKKILIKNIPLDEKLKVKKFFTNVDEFITYGEYIGEKTEFLITKNKEDRTDQPEDSREEVLNLLESLEQERLLDNLKPQEEKEIQRFYFILKYLYYNKQIEIWKPEFSLNFEQVEKQGLYLIYEDGRGLHNYEFSKETVQDPSLISGMFTAITAFIKETTKSAEVLKTIDHGDITILIEYGKHFFGALFIKGNQTSEIRSQLKDFINRFQNQHMDTLKQWTGATAPFKDTDKTIEDIFKEE